MRQDMCLVAPYGMIARRNERAIRTSHDRANVPRAVKGRNGVAILSGVRQQFQKVVARDDSRRNDIRKRRHDKRTCCCCCCCYSNDNDESDRRNEFCVLHQIQQSKRTLTFGRHYSYTTDGTESYLVGGFSFVRLSDRLTKAVRIFFVRRTDVDVTVRRIGIDPFDQLYDRQQETENLRFVDCESRTIHHYELLPPVLLPLLYSPIPGCTGLRPDNLAYNPEFESTIESALSTGPWNSFEMGSGIPRASTRADSYNTVQKRFLNISTNSPWTKSRYW